MIRTKINGRYTLMLPPHRHEFFKDNEWEVERLEAMRQAITKDDIVLEVGSEEGDITALLAKWAKGIYIIEASPGFWPNIKAIFKANNLPDPLGCFAGFASSTNDLNPPNLNYHPTIENGWPLCANGQVRVGTGFRHLSQETDATPQIKIDSFCDAWRPPAPTILSLDVEGSELEALKGAKRLLTLDRPIVFVSVHPLFMKEMYGSTPEDVRTFMESLGYRGKLIAIDHEDHWVFEHPDNARGVI